jgi:hypothetical protein
VKETEHERLHNQLKSCFSNGIKMSADHWAKCIEKDIILQSNAFLMSVIQINPFMPEVEIFEFMHEIHMLHRKIQGTRI